MSLLSEYTLSLLEKDKIAVDFTDTTVSFYELGEILRFFRKYKKEVYIEHDGEIIFYLVSPWQHWVEFLIDMGFQDTAKACCEVLNDLETENTPTMTEYVTQLKKARIIKEYEKKQIPFQKKTADYEKLKEHEITRLTKNEKLYTFNPPSSSEIAFNQDYPRVLAEHEGAYVAYLDGKIAGLNDDEQELINIIKLEKRKEPDLIRKIEEIKEKEQEETE